ncbi:MAG TPA: M14 family metallopeptidase [Bacteroidales bacterium]|nr:M14 family metallopeptidase [Bacteroidales bacterium]
MKVIINTLIACCLSILASCNTSSAQTSYHNHDDIIKELNNLAGSYAGVCKLDIIGQSHSGKDMYALTIGTGNYNHKPGIAIIGGIDGRYPAGREISLGFAKKLLANTDNEDIKELLASVSFYVIPDASPDASSGFFSAPILERLVNANPTDNDRDFETDEDPAEDINGDGLITMMRIKDPTGDYITDPADSRLMKKADRSKGERGEWHVYTEGVDNDKDGKFNEDGQGGVNFNNNFSFEYEEFGENAGINAVSEKETRAVADFLYDHFNIFAVFSFGPQDNLGQAFKAKGPSPRAGRRGPGKVTSILKEDEALNKLLSSMYLEQTGYKGNPGFIREPGNFMEWAYYHYGRYSYSTPGWWFPSEKGLSAEASFLKYADENLDEEVFVEWQEADHPDFPGKTVEVGGIVPFSMYAPPPETLDKAIENNYLFLVDAAKLHPAVELVDLKTEKLKKDIHRVSVTLHNKGIFSTTSELGNYNKWMRKMKVELSSDSDFELMSGRKIEITERLKGGQSREYSWLIHGKGNFTISAGAVNCGIDRISFTIK